ncbi:MAG: stalk domain-containing protein [Symbiobacteriia bacterium]
MELTGDTPAVPVNNRTMVPIRSVAEALGATVTWDEKESAAVISTASAPAAQTSTTDTQALIQEMEAKLTVPIDQARKMATAVFVNDTSKMLGYVAWHSYTDDRMAYEASCLNRQTLKLERTSSKPDGIYNHNSPYGSDASDTSAYNLTATHPPVLVLMRPAQQPVAYITKNPAFTRRIDPDDLLTVLSYLK